MPRKIKILFTIPNFETAGSTKVLYDLASGLDAAKFEVSIACDHDRGAFFAEVEKLGFPIYLVKTTTNYRPYSSLNSRLKPIARFFKEHQFDIVHSWHWSSDWTEVLAARKAGVKWVYTKKAMSWGNKHWKIRSYLAHFIFTINAEMSEYFSYKKNQKLVPLGIDTEYYNPSHFPQKIIDQKQFKIVTVANLVPVKGIEVLINAVAQMNDPAVSLNVVGGSEATYLTKLKELCVELGVEKQIQFLGKKADVRPFIAESDVYVIPTLNEGRKEGMPMALVEAMCMAVPVLGSDISGINFVLNGFPQLLFKASNTSELAEKLTNLKNIGPERIALGNELRTYCVENFTMRQFIEKSEDVYVNLVKAKMN